MTKMNIELYQGLYMSLQLRMQMAVKQYGYYFKGSKLALVEKDTSFDNDVTSKEYGPGSDRAQWKSPLSNIADGLEIEYTYVLNYKINRTDTTHTDLVKYRASSSGKLELRGPDGTNYDTTMDAGNYMVLSNAGKFNGLHKIDSFANSGGTGDIIQLDTSYSGANSSWTDFERTVTLYYDVSVLQVDGETFDLDIPVYLEEAIIYYMKARLAEDAQQIEQREYFMNLFKKRLEGHNNTRVWGARMISSGTHAIR